ncbi:MAG: TlpA family protein disulfide reductase, partial [Nitrosopumilus sp.]
MKSKEYSAETFEKFSLQGTPSTILVDRKGILRDISFGQSEHVEAMIQKLLKEN